MERIITEASIAQNQFLFRGVSKEFHSRNDGRLIPKSAGAFQFQGRWDAGEKWDAGWTWDKTAHNAVVRHQLRQEGYPTSGISTTPHFERAAFYARSGRDDAHGLVYKINRECLAAMGIECHVVADHCKPSVPDDDEVILVIGDHEFLPVSLIIDVLEV